MHMHALYSRHIHAHLHRSGVLQSYNLTLSDFASQDEAFKCADHFLSQQRKEWSPEMFEKHPEKPCEGFLAADPFWYSNYKGMGTHTALFWVDL
jgi:hypothetical protein